MPLGCVFLKSRGIFCLSFGGKYVVIRIRGTAAVVLTVVSADVVGIAVGIQIDTGERAGQAFIVQPGLCRQICSLKLLQIYPRAVVWRCVSD